MRHYGDLTGIPAKHMLPWLGIARSKFYDWRRRYGKVNEHNALVPRDHRLEDWERRAIVDFHLAHLTDGYRRITFMMLDLNLVAVSPATTWRVLSRAGLLKRWNTEPPKKGSGFVQPLRPHEHWHIDIAYINIRRTFFFLIGVLDGCSRYLVHWELRARMTEADVEIVLQKAHEQFPEAQPRIISDSTDSKSPPTAKRTPFTGLEESASSPTTSTDSSSPLHPAQGHDPRQDRPLLSPKQRKIERFHKTIEGECLRQKTPLSLDQAKRVGGECVAYYNDAAGTLYPFGTPEAYVERGSLHVTAGTDYQGHSTGSCWLGVFYPRALRALPPADCGATASWMLYQ